LLLFQIEALKTIYGWSVKAYNKNICQKIKSDSQIPAHFFN